MTVKTKTDPDLTMTEEEVAAVLDDARAEAEQAARDLEAAERTVRGEAPPVGARAMAGEVTPARLAELRTGAEFAAMKVTAAERRTEEIREKRLTAHRAQVAARVREEAASDLDGAEHLIGKLDAFEAALKELLDATAAHNARIAAWQRQMSEAGVSPSHDTTGGAGGLAWSDGERTVSIDGKTFRYIRGGQLVGATLHRVIRPYPIDFRKHVGDFDLAHVGDLVSFTPSPETDGPIDLRAMIRRDA
ncbi:hypothetical protein [Sphaerisporangium rhizosphaerae]|uniref:DUF342 domain-containing protein n=1 Tax=Sphaerisporangium rhizosphaerae TaxID=2269375 RepID=A0ABW2P1P6_9ACTN